MGVQAQTASGRAVGTLPETMRAAAIDRFGGPDVLTIHELPVPEPDAAEVLIAVDTAGVGSWDVDMREGWWPGGKPRFPLVLGTDGAGIVAAVGADVRRLRVGDAVYSYSWMNPKGGFYAEYVAVPEETAASIPPSLDLEHAGAIPTIGLTALQGIEDALRVKPGETVIVHGASGGVGHLAVQFAKLAGARVIGTARGDDGVAFVRSLGADAAVDGAAEDIAAAAGRVAPDGVDAVLGTAGGKALERCIDTVRPGGRVAYPNGVEPEPRKRQGIDLVVYDAVVGVQEFDRLTLAVEAAKLIVRIAGEYPLPDAAEAHRRLARGHVLGKIVLRVA
jgi:NADPH2:quinone reductase